METAIVITFIAILIVIGLVIMLKSGQDHSSAPRPDLRADLEAARDKEIDIDYRQAYNLAGVNKRGLDPLWHCGSFHGYVVRDVNNQHDRHAIAVFAGAKQHVGFIPAEEAKKLAKKLDVLGGQCPCVMEIRRAVEEGTNRGYFVGCVQILWPDTE